MWLLKYLRGRWLVKCGACHDRFDMEDPQAGWCERCGPLCPRCAVKHECCQNR